MTPEEAADLAFPAAGGAFGLEIMWAVDYIFADIAYARWAAVDPSHFRGVTGAPCISLEVGAGALETASIAATGGDSKITGLVEGLDYGITGACTLASAANDFADAHRLSGGANIVGAICNVVEAGMEVAATQDSGNDALGHANTYVDIGCAAAGILIGFATADPIMVIASAFALIMQIMPLIEAAIMNAANSGFTKQLYLEAYENGSECVNEETEILSTPLLMFYTGLHSNSGKAPHSRYGYYVQAVDYSSADGINRSLFPAIAP